MKEKARLLWDVTKGAASDFFEDNVFRLSAALAYYAVFSLAPLLIIVIGAAGLVLGDDAVRGEVERQLRGFMGETAAETIQSMLAAREESSSLIATIVGIGVLIFGATGVFGELQNSLNTIWEVKPKPNRGIMGFIKDRFLSFSMVLGIAFLLLISMVISSLLHAFGGYLGGVLPIPEAVMYLLNFVIAFGVITALFAMMFKFLPDAKIQWKDVWVGAVGTALLFTIGKFAISYYLGRESTTSAYGAAGSLIVVLLWVFYSSLILFFGAEFTQVYAAKTGSEIVPTENAMRIDEADRAQKGLAPSKRPETATRPETTTDESVPDLVYAVHQATAPAVGSASAFVETDYSSEMESESPPAKRSFKPYGIGLLVLGWVFRKKIAALKHVIGHNKAPKGNGLAAFRKSLMPKNRISRHRKS